MSLPPLARLDEKPDCCAPQPAGLLPKAPLPLGSCDTHVHVFGPASTYRLSAGRSYTPQLCTLQQYKSVMQTCGITRAVLVQPSVYGTDNSCLLNALREGGSAFRGVVVPEAGITDTELDNMHALGVRGIRLNLVNPQVLTIDDAVTLCSRIAERGWHLQVQLHLTNEADEARFKALIERVALRVDLPVVVDHMGRPLSDRLPTTLLALLKEGRCWVKLSAPYRITAQTQPATALAYADVLPLAHALVAANAGHLLWASDWPHTEQTHSTPSDADLVDLLQTWVPETATGDRILIDNPARLYGY